MFHKVKHHWRRFRSRYRRHNKRFRHRDYAVDKKHMTQPVDVAFVCSSTDFFDCVEEEVVSLLQRRPEIHALDEDIS